METPVLGGMFICRPAPIESGYDRTHGFSCIGDLHIGAGQVDYPKIKKDIATAVEKKDRLNIIGDVFDLILCQDKKRFQPDCLHPRLQGRRDIVNAAVKWGVEILGPAADLIDVIAIGNHETAVEKHGNYDPIQALIYELEALRTDKKHIIHYGGYTGFIDYRFRGTHKQSFRYVIYYHHGSGATAPVTKGLIDFNRRDTFIDADVIWMGHKHNRLSVSVEKISCPISGDQPSVKDVRHIMTGAYFNTYGGQTQASVRKEGRKSNYAADAGYAPQGRGGVRIELSTSNTSAGYLKIEDVHVIQ